MNFEDSRTFQEVFDEFVTSKMAQGVADATLNNYKYHLRSISKYLDIERPFKEIKKRDIENIAAQMRVINYLWSSLTVFILCCLVPIAFDEQ